jgi:hypothetical protein
VSHVSIAHPLTPPRETTRSPALVELRFAIEAEVAQRLVRSGSNPTPRLNDSENLGQPSSAIVVRLHREQGASRGHLEIGLRLDLKEIGFGAREVDVTIMHGLRMVHLDAYRPGAAQPLLSISIERETGRTAFTRSTIPAELGLRGGTYDPAQAAIVWE